MLSRIHGGLGDHSSYGLSTFSEIYLHHDARETAYAGLLMRFGSSFADSTIALGMHQAAPGVSMPSSMSIHLGG